MKFTDDKLAEKTAEAGATRIAKDAVERLTRRTQFSVVAGGESSGRTGSRAAKRFQEKVAALQSISNPNAVRIYRSDTTPDGALYFAMEFIDGKTLRDLLKSGPPASASLRQPLPPDWQRSHGIR